MAFPPFPAFPENLITYILEDIYMKIRVYMFIRVQKIIFYREHRENREQTQKT